MNIASLTCDRPWWLLLLAIAPLLWLWGRRSLAGMGPVRRRVVMALRIGVLTLLAIAAAEPRWVRTHEGVTVLYLLDQSASIPDRSRQAIIDYVNAAKKKHRQHGDRWGVIAFGREAHPTNPPFDDDVPLATNLGVEIDRRHTNVAGAMKLALGMFPEDTAKRIVVVSDGNENLGRAIEQARQLADARVSIDVVPVVYHTRAEIIVEKVAVSSDVQKGQPFDLRVVVHNTAEATNEDSGEVAGRLTISRRAQGTSTVLAERQVVLPPGKKVFTVSERLEAPDFYTYEARFVPDRGGDDAMLENNLATTFTHVRGSGQVLLIEDKDHKGEHDRFVDRLKQENLEVTVRSTEQAITGLPELQQYDTIILANVPREDFSDEQIRVLVRNTQQFGGGLIMLGGENSFAAGGWTNTELEQAMPVDFDIKAAKVVPRGALVLLMHASEMDQGNHWQKVIGQEAVKGLGSEDYCGVTHWSGIEQWLWTPGLRTVGENRQMMLGRISRMTPGDMPDFTPTMRLALNGFLALPPGVTKHMIIISDGDPEPPAPGPNGLLQAFVQNKITISTVAIAAHGAIEQTRMKMIADTTGGKYYPVTNPKALPRIYQREARRVARPVIYENPNGFQPSRAAAHEMFNGLSGNPPPLTGYVMTTRKPSGLVEVSLLAPEPAGATDNNTLLASWTYGVGKVVAFTSDVGPRWGSRWLGWSGYDKLFSQMIRWSMRPGGDQGRFTVATDLQDGRVRVVVTALDKDDEFLNFLEMNGAVIGPNMEPIEMRVSQTAPGRYVGSFDAPTEGAYFIMVQPNGTHAGIRTGINVPYSAEYRTRESNEPLLRSLAAIAPPAVAAGIVTPAISAGPVTEDLLATNSFRRDLPLATSSQDVWHFILLVAAVAFVGDVLFRRVIVSFAWAAPIARRVVNFVLRRETAPAAAPHLDRLRSRKAALADKLESQRAAARFEPLVDPRDLADEFGAAPAGPKPSPAPPAKPLAPDQPAGEAEHYTSRLLKAKRRATEQKPPEGPQ